MYVVGRIKTYKREVAGVILIWLIYLSIWGSLGALEIVIWPAFVFILGAYGLDEQNKNGTGGVGVTNLSGLFRAKSSEPTDRGRS